MELSNAFSAVDVDMHCQKVVHGFSAVHVLFGGACCFSAVDLELFGGGCCFSAVYVLFGGGLKNSLLKRGGGGTLGSVDPSVRPSVRPSQSLPTAT